MDRAGGNQAGQMSKKGKKKYTKEESDRQKQAEKKRRRLEKALANSAAIISELEKKRQQKQKEQQRLDDEGAAIAEAVALHVLIGEDCDEPRQLIWNDHSTSRGHQDDFVDLELTPGAQGAGEAYSSGGRLTHSGGDRGGPAGALAPPNTKDLFLKIYEQCSLEEKLSKPAPPNSKNKDILPPPLLTHASHSLIPQWRLTGCGMSEPFSFSSWEQLSDFEALYCQGTFPRSDTDTCPNLVRTWTVSPLHVGDGSSSEDTFPVQGAAASSINIMFSGANNSLNFYRREF